MGWFATSALIFVGAGIGANARYWLSGWVAGKWGAFFPYGTMVVNVSGSLLIGIFLGFALRETWSPEWRIFLAIGILGGYTTFSTFSYETMQLISQRSYLSAGFNIVGSVVLCLIATWIGIVISRMFAGG